MGALIFIITVLYACTGIISIIGYLPTIKDLLSGKPSANIQSYAIWTLTSGISFLYALIVINNALLEAVLGLNFLSCAAILLLSARLAIKMKKEKPKNRPKLRQQKHLNTP
jgi:hypothetical protein